LIKLRNARRRAHNTNSQRSRLILYMWYNDLGQIRKKMAVEKVQNPGNGIGRISLKGDHEWHVS